MGVSVFQEGDISLPTESIELENPSWLSAQVSTLKSYLTFSYPKYKHLIPDNPTEEQFELSWKYIFGAKFSECEITLEADSFNLGFEVKKPDGKIHHHGGFGLHTEIPDLKGKCFYYNGWGSWDTDDSGIRYYKIDRSTMLPYNFKNVIAIETIQRYILNNANKRELSDVSLIAKLANA